MTVNFLQFQFDSFYFSSQHYNQTLFIPSPEFMTSSLFFCSSYSPRPWFPYPIPTPSFQVISLYSAELFILQNLSKLLFSSINKSSSSTTRFNCTTLWILAEFVSTYLYTHHLFFPPCVLVLMNTLPNLLDCELFKSRGYMLHLSLWACSFGLFSISTSKTPMGPITQYIYFSYSDIF